MQIRLQEIEKNRYEVDQKKKYQGKYLNKYRTKHKIKQMEAMWKLTLKQLRQNYMNNT